MSIFPLEDLSNVSARQAARCVRQKNLFCDQNFKMKKFSPNLLKFGVKVPHQVSCSAKEALAKI